MTVFTDYRLTPLIQVCLSELHNVPSLLYEVVEDVGQMAENPVHLMSSTHDVLAWQIVPLDLYLFVNGSQQSP